MAETIWGNEGEKYKQSESIGEIEVALACLNNLKETNNDTNTNIELFKDKDSGLYYISKNGEINKNWLDIAQLKKISNYSDGRPLVVQMIEELSYLKEEVYSDTNIIIEKNNIDKKNNTEEFSYLKEETYSEEIAYSEEEKLRDYKGKEFQYKLDMDYPEYDKDNINIHNEVNNEWDLYTFPWSPTEEELAEMIKERNLKAWL